MDRRRFLLTSLVGALAAPLAAVAQQAYKAGKVYRVGVLSAASRNSITQWLNELEHALANLGWVQGRNLVIEYRFAEGRQERLPDLAADLVRLKVDVILAAGTGPGALAAKHASTAIPIVVLNHPDPVGSGLVASLARPGGNVTGLSTFSPDLVGKELQLLTEAVPRLSRVAVLRNPTNQAQLAELREAEIAVRPLGMQLQILDAPTPGEFASAFAAMTKEGAGALLILRDPLFFLQRTRIAELAAKRRLPAMAYTRELVEAGLLMAYGPDQRDIWRRSATFVDKILKGAKPADLPVEQPTEFELVINLKTAKALGLTIPPSLLARADQVIE
jgi:putative tryptophan/tyrosine transport system substrate-binding protein